MLGSWGSSTRLERNAVLHGGGDVCRAERMTAGRDVICIVNLKAFVKEAHNQKTERTEGSVRVRV